MEGVELPKADITCSRFARTLGLGIAGCLAAAFIPRKSKKAAAEADAGSSSAAKGEDA